MYSKKLINKEVRLSPTFGKIEIDFLAMVSIYQWDAKKLIEVCSLFIECLSTAGGPAQEEAMALARDWEKEVFKDHQVSFSLTEVVTKFIPQEVQLSSNDNLAKEIRNLHKKYAKLITDIITYYASSGKHDAIVIARWVQYTFDESGLARDHVTVDEIFDRMQPHHSFIDVNAINDLIDDYPINDTELKTRFNEYSNDVNKFLESVRLDDIVKTIQKAINGESTKSDPKIILKLSGKWNNMTIGHLHKLMKCLFNQEAECITIIQFLQGSICIRFLVSSDRLVKSLIVKSQTKFPFLHLLGIFQLIIHNQTIIDKEEDVNFTFEESLLQCISSIESCPEYHQLLLLLIELKINLNYQSMSGQTALMLASIGGHIEIFKLLLQNDANPFVKLLENERFIGLNKLASIALSQHIYKSIGGEKVIPQDGILVTDMLDMAVKERGVSTHFYYPFTHLVNNNFKKRFQDLQISFHALSSNFIDAAMNSLTSKAMITEAKQEFQPYIGEDAICEDAHQLVQLLKPHYSYFNINLLLVACTITEPITEQVEDYNVKLKIFNDTTSLLELAATLTMIKGILCPDDVAISKLLIRLNKSWCSRTITDLNRMVEFYLPLVSPFLSLQEIHHDSSSLTCMHLIPQLQINPLRETIWEQQDALYQIGVFEVLIDDIPLIMEDDDESFTFEAALQEAHQDDDTNILFFLPEIGISLPLQNGTTNLMIACERGNFLSVQFMLNIEPDINIQNTNGWTALMFASLNGHHQVVELLLSKNPDINIQNNHGMTALMAASSNGHLQVVELLLSKSPNINIQDNNGLTALAVSSINAHYKVVELLLSCDPNINLQDSDEATALMGAIHHGNHQIVKLLLSKDADVNIQNNGGLTALMVASIKGYHQIMNLLMNKISNIDIQNKEGLTALMMGSSNGHYQVVELLLSRDPNINLQDIDGSTALMDASSHGYHEVVELLLRNNPDIDIQNNRKMTALMFGSSHGHYKVVELLLSCDPNINLQAIDGLTALMAACHNGHYQVVELLLSKDPDVNIQSNDEFTALMLANCCKHHRVIENLQDKDLDSINELTALIAANYSDRHEVVKLLLSKNADVNIKNSDGSTALIFASSQGYYKNVELILTKNPDINTQNNNRSTALMVASCMGHYQVVDLLLRHDPNINLQDIDGWTALMAASCMGHYQVVDLLLRHDPNINLQDIDGSTALMAASHNGYCKVVELLLGKDPDINIQNKDGWTALMGAIRFGHHRIVKHLLSNNPNINLKDNDGLTALMYACLISNDHQVSIVELLLSKDPDVSIQSNDRVTALMAASYNGQVEVVELIMCKNPDIDIQDSNGWTALMSASYSGAHQVVKLLLSKNPDINIQNKDGLTALMIASFYGHYQVVELLLTKNPDIDIQDNNGCSALTYILACSKLSFKRIETNDALPFDQRTRLLNNMESGNYVRILELLLDSNPNHSHNIKKIFVKCHSLAVAAAVNNFDAVTLLMKKTDITPENIISAFTYACYGCHPLMIIYMSKKIATLSTNERKLLIAAAEGDLETLNRMIHQIGMSPNTSLPGDITPLMIAALCGHVALVEVLIQAGAETADVNDVLQIVSCNPLYDLSDIKKLLTINSPARKVRDPLSNKAETTNASIPMQIFDLLFSKKEYKPSCANPNLAMISPV